MLVYGTSHPSLAAFDRHSRCINIGEGGKFEFIITYATASTLGKTKFIIAYATFSRQNEDIIEEKQIKLHEFQEIHSK